MPSIVLGCVWMILVGVGAPFFMQVNAVYGSCLQLQETLWIEIGASALFFAPGLALTLRRVPRPDFFWALSLGLAAFAGVLFLVHQSRTAECANIRPETKAERRAWKAPVAGQAIDLRSQPCTLVVAVVDHVVAAACEDQAIIMVRAGQPGWIRRFPRTYRSGETWLERSARGPELVTVEGSLVALNLIDGTVRTRALVRPENLSGPIRILANPTARCLVATISGAAGQGTEQRVYPYEPDRHELPLQLTGAPELAHKVATGSNALCVRGSDGEAVLLLQETRNSGPDFYHALLRYDRRGVQELATSKGFEFMRAEDPRRVAAIDARGDVLLLDADRPELQRLPAPAGRRWLAFDAATRSGVQAAELRGESGDLQGTDVWGVTADGKVLAGPRQHGMITDMTRNVEPGRFVLRSDSALYWPLQ